MNYRILRTEHANEQLLDIVRYIAELSQSYDTAMGILQRIENAMAKLASAPHSGSFPRYRSLRRRGFRVLIVDKYLIFYKCDDAQETVTVYHIVDSRTDYQKQI